MNQPYTRPPWYKRTFIVESNFQSRITMLILFAGFMGSVGFLFGWIYLDYRFLEALGSIIDTAPPAKRDLVFSAWNQVFYVSILFCFLFCGALVVVSLFFSNRIAGPIYRIDLELKKMLTSNVFNEIKTRKSDFFKSHLDVINEVIARLREKSS